MKRGRWGRLSSDDRIDLFLVTSRRRSHLYVLDGRMNSSFEAVSRTYSHPEYVQIQIGNSFSLSFVTDGSLSSQTVLFISVSVFLKIFSCLMKFIRDQHPEHSDFLCTNNNILIHSYKEIRYFLNHKNDLKLS